MGEKDHQAKCKFQFLQDFKELTLEDFVYLILKCNFIELYEL